MNILVVNAGSSSLKYQLINTDTEVSYAKGVCERIGDKGSAIIHKQLIKKTKFEKEVRHDVMAHVHAYGAYAKKAMPIIPI